MAAAIFCPPKLNPFAASINLQFSSSLLVDRFSVHVSQHMRPACLPNLLAIHGGLGHMCLRDCDDTPPRHGAADHGMLNSYIGRFYGGCIVSTRTIHSWRGSSLDRGICEPSTAFRAAVSQSGHCRVAFTDERARLACRRVTGR